MTRLEDITVGANVAGIAGDAPVNIVAAKWHGNAVLEITFKDTRGQLASQLLYREDEAHKMSATVWGGEVKYTKRFQLGRLLSSISRHFLLLTATPHNGKEEDFQLFMSLIDHDRFEGVARSSHQAVDVSDVMRRLVKEDLLKFDGASLFPERLAYTVNYDLSPMEAQLYTAVTEYVEGEFNRADNMNGERKTTVGFALTILQRRLASSPEAIYQSLKRRRERLENRLSEERLGKRASEYAVSAYDDDDMPSAELTALNKPDEYILAIVEVGDDQTKTVYLKRPFRERPDFAATSVNYNIMELMNGSEIILDRGKYGDD